MRPACLALLTLVLLTTTAAADFRPDPRSVQRYGPAYRYPQDGWIVLHIEGEPYERGVQHGRLLASEIAQTIRCLAAMQGHKAPAEAWQQTRTLANALFLRRYKEEYLKEMQGVADGATAAGARFDGKPLDLVDMVALNGWAEIDTLDSALEATPTGLEGVRFPKVQPRAMPADKSEHCSAFAATGPATADGKIVFGHITMFGLYAANQFNVWLDVKPARGHRVLMQTYPGGVQSGMDYYLNDAGLIVCETTIRQTRFDVKGLALASRIRDALQYADSIDEAVRLLRHENNGLYTNEWLLADTKTNEIAMLELGTHRSKLWRSSKDEWVGGTRGFYWGCNNVKDLDVRLETVASTDGRPANLVFRPSERDKTWLKLYDQHKGKINADFGKLVFTTPPVAAYHSLDAKYTTTDLAKQLKTHALFGPPLGLAWRPTFDEKQRYPEVKALVSNPWTVLHAGAPQGEPGGPLVIDLPKRDGKAPVFSSADESAVASKPAWHGTLRPGADADTWLAAAFADYERMVSDELARRGDSEPSTHEKDRLAVALYRVRSSYLSAARAGGDVPLMKTTAETRDDQWYKVASGKGLLLLHELRRTMGDRGFLDLMDRFGTANAGKPASVEAFVAAAGPERADFFKAWLRESGLPHYTLTAGKATPNGDGHTVTATIVLNAPWPGSTVDVTLETAKGEQTMPARFTDRQGDVTFTTKDEPRRLIVDKYSRSAKDQGGVFTTHSFLDGLARTLIVYGTHDESAANREAAELLQRALVERGPNMTVPTRSDREVTAEELKTHHLILIGRPDSNVIVEKCRAALPVEFGPRSFVVRNEAFAHAGSAVIAAGENPWDRKFSVVAIAGLSATATWEAAPRLAQNLPTAEVVILPHGGGPRPLVVPAKELVRELK